jgi:predicted adenylyl cyclase CyaB
MEIKARCKDWRPLHDVLMEAGARFIGQDHQVDTYFRIDRGRLKWREGEIENHLIYYRRPDREGPKRSDVQLYPVSPGASLKALLADALGILTVVDKKRRIYFIENVKFHLDEVSGLGAFVEIEAIGKEMSASPKELEAQCRHYMALLNIDPADWVDLSYSDLLLNSSFR